MSKTSRLTRRGTRYSIHGPVLEVPCVYCEAEIGQTCRTRYGVESEVAHMARVRAFMKLEGKREPMPEEAPKLDADQVWTVGADVGNDFLRLRRLEGPPGSFRFQVMDQMFRNGEFAEGGCCYTMEGFHMSSVEVPTGGIRDLHVRGRCRAWDDCDFQVFPGSDSPGVCMFGIRRLVQSYCEHALDMVKRGIRALPRQDPAKVFFLVVAGSGPMGPSSKAKIERRLPEYAGKKLAVYRGVPMAVRSNMVFTIEEKAK